MKDLFAPMMFFFFCTIILITVSNSLRKSNDKLYKIPSTTTITKITQSEIYLESGHTIPTYKGAEVGDTLKFY